MGEKQKSTKEDGIIDNSWIDMGCNDQENQNPGPNIKIYDLSGFGDPGLYEEVVPGQPHKAEKYIPPAEE